MIIDILIMIGWAYLLVCSLRRPKHIINLFNMIKSLMMSAMRIPKRKISKEPDYLAIYRLERSLGLESSLTPEQELHVLGRIREGRVSRADGSEIYR